MTKFKVKNLAIIIVFGVLLIGTVGIVNAQEVLPTGGDSFGTAVELEAGSYITDHNIPRNAPEYFKLPIIKAGQTFIVEVTNPLTGAADILSNTGLYNEDRVELLPSYAHSLDDIYGAGKNSRFGWLLNSNQDSYIFYMTIGGGGIVATTKGTEYDISIEDMFDAGSQMDAGDNFGEAMRVTTGEYQSYLSGKWGTDTKDFYKIAVEKGEQMTVKVTPEGEAAMKVSIYNSDRQVIKEEYAPNPGAIITNSVAVTEKGDVFIAVICDEYCSKKGSAAYILNIVTGGVPLEETEEGVAPGVEEGVLTGQEEIEEAAKTIGKGIAAGIILWIVGPIVLLIIIGIVIYFLLKKKKAKTPPAHPSTH